MNPKDFFLTAPSAAMRQYEVLKAFYTCDISAAEAAAKFSFSPAYFKKLRFEFAKQLKAGIIPFFQERRPGPTKRHTTDKTTATIIALRKQNHSIADIRAALAGQSIVIALDTIDRILKEEGFAPLPKRTRQERRSALIPNKIEAPQSLAIDIHDEEFTTERGAGALCFLPLLEKLKLIPAIEAAAFPSTAALSNVQSVLSLLALKLTGSGRWSHDTGWNFDRALGLFAGLNVLPKSGTLSTYSYRVKRSAIRSFLEQLACIFRDEAQDEGEFNLDFKAIPHWGDESVLQKNWSGSRNKAIKSLLALIVAEPANGFLSYSNAEIRHSQQNDAVLDFVDFWKNGRGQAPKMLIFDSKFTNYKNLNQINQDKDGIKFLTLRRRGKGLIERVARLPEHEWQRIKVERTKGGSMMLRVHDSRCTLRHYEGEVRQIILTDHGREKPAFLISNDFEMQLPVLVRKYAKRWLVEQEIAEHIAFFHMNHPSSSIVIKVDFDLALSLLAHNLYRVLARELPGFEQCTAPTIHRRFLENGALCKIEGRNITVALKKKSHIPILLGVPWMKEPTNLSWMGSTINFTPGTYS